MNISGFDNSLCYVDFDSNMPRDPFADDPNDPASFLDADEPMPELSDEERIMLEQDLRMVRGMAKILPQFGIDGIFFICEDCEEQHYYDWDIMAANMRSTLDGELAPVHEPSAQPNTDRYTPWEYAVGFYDGLNRKHLN